MYKYVLAGLLTLVLSGLSWSATKFVIDPAHSDLGFKVSHMVISKVRGEFQDYTGTLMWDANDPSKSSVEVTIQTNSIDTDNEKRDGHLKSPDFFNAEKFPTITFKSEKIWKDGDQYKVRGKFSMRGVTKTIEFPFNPTQVIEVQGQKKMGVQAETKVDRYDYGIEWNKTMEMGGFVVGKEVEIDLDTEWMEPQDKKTEDE